MSAHLDIDDVAAQSELAQRQLAELRALLAECLPHVRSAAQASHLTDGFHPRRNALDELVEMVETETDRALDIQRHKVAPCMECGAETPKQAETMCRCSGDKDHCHGVDLWPDA